MTELRIMNHLSKKIYFFSNSFGPMGKYDKYLKETLNLSTYIMVRDGHNYSKKLLNKYGVSQVVNGPDDLFNISCFYNIKNKNIKNEYVIIEIMSWIEKANRSIIDIKKILCDFTNYLIEHEKKDVFYINFDKNDNKAKMIIDELYKMNNYKNHIYVNSEIDNVITAYSLYSCCDYSLSFRYHPVILSLSYGKPSIAIITDKDGYYESKLKGAYENCDMRSNYHVIDIDNLDLNILINNYEKCKNDLCKESVRNRLNKIRNDYLNEILSN